MNVSDSEGNCPLWQALETGQEDIAQILVHHKCDVNLWSEGPSQCQQTLLHRAIDENNEAVACFLIRSLNLTVKDRSGHTPFAAAMMTRNNKAAQAILDREPTAAEQVDNRGRNFLHTAIQKSDIESVLFLISVHANVNSRTQDSHHLTPLHLAVMAGSEIIVRNLLLAGAAVNEKTHTGETALHLAAVRDHAQIVSVLIENGVDVDAVDENLNNELKDEGVKACC
nr:hypothetical protein BaRGS_011918 [Batillaria attramentaria]